MCHFRINNTLEEFLFAFEDNPYWEDLAAFVSWMCEVAQYMNEKAEDSMEGQSGKERATAYHKFYSDGFLSVVRYCIPWKEK